MNDVTYLLINPPITDPTGPYHSLSYLAGAAHQAGFDQCEMIDLNIDSLNFLAQHDRVTKLLDFARSRHENLVSLASQRTLTRREAMHLEIAECAVTMQAEWVLEAIESMQSNASFYDYPLYCAATDVLESWLALLSLQGYPYQFGSFALNTACAVNMNASRELGDNNFLDTLNAPLVPAYEELLYKRLYAVKYDVIGLSINYISQLPFALYLIRRIREICPDAFVIAGGTDVSDTVKYARRIETVSSLFQGCDALVVGEGETVFVDILTARRNGETLSAKHKGVILLSDPENTGAVTENLQTLASPDYTITDSSHYWSPTTVYQYSPTRGCYWNRCTFCDYGLNTDMPTSPSREVPVDQAVRDLAVIAERSGYAYLAVDAMSPSYLRKLCGAIDQAGLDIKWSAELRIEKSMRNGDFAELMRKAGCVAVSFGLESGSQRILDLIDKGVRIDDVPDTLSSLNHVGIAVQMMAFTGFPTETEIEKSNTESFLEQTSDHWTLKSVGTFGLTAGSIVAKDPNRFAVQIERFNAREDIPRQMSWRSAEGEIRDRPGVLGLAVSSESKGRVERYLERPWAGGIDTAHSILYFGKHGKRLIGSNESRNRTQYSWFSKPIKDDAGDSPPQTRISSNSALSQNLSHFVFESRKTLGRNRSMEEIEAWYAVKTSGEEALIDTHTMVADIDRKAIVIETTELKGHSS